jgi:hypothetical protein
LTVQHQFRLTGQLRHKFAPGDQQLGEITGLPVSDIPDLYALKLRIAIFHLMLSS